MASLQIRDVPQDVYDALAERAARARRSLAQQAIVELSQVPELMRRERKRQVIAEIREEIAKYGTRTYSLEPAAAIREDRDR